MSGLRCWPGCLAVVVASDYSHLIGMTVEVLHEAPRDWFVDPAGQLHVGAGSEFAWLVKLSRPARIPTNAGSFRAGLYAMASDHKLRPITPPPGTDCTTHDADKPQPVETA